VEPKVSIMTRTRGRIVRGALLCVASSTIARADVQAQERPLEEMTLEELMGIEVTTVGRSAVAELRVPAAVYVITREAIESAGATTLAEALRLAPGLQVARIDAGKWAIGSRGFADRLARSMRVLIDGRPVYSPLFTGVYWESQDALLEHVERIEVIRGPGGTLWGSNAVNGTVSIITRRASDTQGLYATAGAGTEVSDVALAYGRAVGDDSYARVYAKGFDWTPQHNADGEPEYDDWRLAQTGFRFDGSVSGGRTLTVSGDAYVGRMGQYLRVTDLAPPYLTVTQEDVGLSGGNVLARLAGPVGADTELELMSYVELTDRNEYPVSEHRRTAEVDLQLRHRRWPSHEINWGLAWQGSWADLDAAPTSSLPEKDEHLLSGFLQDEISMLDDRVRFTLGAKLEHNQYSGLEVQPGARVAWLVDERSTVWASVTRAVRRPSGVERRYTTTSILNPAGPTFVRLLPNPDFQSEKLIAYEAGARMRFGERAYARISGFYNRWDDLLSTELLATIQEPAPPNPPRTVIPVMFDNTLHGSSHGVELMADVRLLPGWTAAGSYSYLRVRTSRDTGSADITQEGRYDGGSPRHQVRLQNSFDLPGGVSLDWHLRYVSELPTNDIAAYTTSNVRLAWRVNDALELHVAGYNLHDVHHVEWPPDNSGAQVEIERRFRAGLTWRR